MKMGRVGAAVLIGVAAVAALVAAKVHMDKADALALLRARAVRDLHDPESARFRDLSLRYMDGTIAQRLADVSWDDFLKAPAHEWPWLVFSRPDGFELCGEVNAKNGFGAYAGYRRFIIASYTADDRVSIEREGGDVVRSVCKITERFVVMTEER